MYIAMDNEIGDMNDLGRHADTILCPIAVQRRSLLDAAFGLIMPCRKRSRDPGTDASLCMLSICGYSDELYTVVLISSRIMAAAISTIELLSLGTLASRSASQFS